MRDSPQGNLDGIPELEPGAKASPVELYGLPADTQLEGDFLDGHA